MKATEAVERALAAPGPGDRIAIAIESSSVNARWANNTATTNGRTDTTTLVVISVVDGSVGMRSSQDLGEVDALVRASVEACKGLPAAVDRMPLTDEAPAGEWETPSEPLSTAALAGLAPALGEMLRDAPADGTLLFGFAEQTATTVTVGTSAGGRRRFHRVRGSFECTGKTADRARSTWTAQVTSDFADVDPLAHLAEMRRRLGWGRNQISLDPGHYQVLLEPSAAADMILYMDQAAMAARDAEEGRTVFSRSGGRTAIGEPVAASDLSLRSDPATAGLEVAPFVVATASTASTSVFDNGVTRAPQDWISSGALRALKRPRWLARDGAPATPSVPNLILSSDRPAGTMEDLIARTERALLVTTLWYIREVDPASLLLTGLTRDGVYLVENGEVKGEVNNFRFNVSPVGMLGNTVEAGDSRPTHPREFGLSLVSIPPLRVDGWNMSTVSPAV